MEELRPVEITVHTARKFGVEETIEPKTLKLNGKFHCWEHYKSDDTSQVYGIIELENGEVGRYELGQFKFTDTNKSSTVA